MEKVYVCSPFKGLDGDYKKNTEYTKSVAKKIFERGDIPIVPHLLLPQFMDDTNSSEREKALIMGLELLDMSNVMEVYCRYGISNGMKNEIIYAESKGKIIRYVE